MAPKGAALDSTFDRDLLEEDDPLVISYSALENEAGETSHASHRHGAGHCGCMARMNTTSKVLLWLSLALVATVLGIAVWKTPSPPSETSYCDYEGYRLPTVGGRPLLEPSLYTVYWRPLFSAPGDLQLSFTGRSTIDAYLNDEADCLLVHAKVGEGYLSFSDVRVDGKKVSSHRYDAANQRLVIQPMLDEVLKKGSHSLSFEYSAPLPYPSNNVGLYLSRYVSDPDERGHTQVVNITATQFEATSARYAMPCLDEPALKANFSVTVDNVPAGYTALGNMPQASSTANADGTSRVTFLTTPRMSTYLVALVVGPVVGVSVIGEDRLNVTAYGMNRTSVTGPPSNIAFAAKVGANVTSFYEKIFGVTFPLPKQDMIAIPDFAAGAMENWGLVTYRETALLGNTNSSSAAELSRVSIVVAHELAHQWFGDIVTMDWWEALWLNEGFATRMEYIGSANANPEFEVDRTFQSVALFPAFRTDAQADVQQLTSPSVDSSPEIEAMFSSISYNKGGSLLRMLDSFFTSLGLGDIKARVAQGRCAYYEGIEEYLKRNSYGSGRPADLWAAFASASGFPDLATWMPVYEQKPGFALVSLDWVGAQPDAREGKLALSQTRFFQSSYSRNLSTAANRDIQYWIPLSYQCQHCSEAVNTTVLRMKDCSSSQPDCAFNGTTWGESNGKGDAITIGNDTAPYSITADGWLKLNVDGTAYYRINYPIALWKALFEQAAADSTLARAARKLTFGDAAQLVDDLFSIVEAADAAFIERGVDTSFALSQARTLFSGTAAESSYEVLTPLLFHVGNLFGLVVPDVPPQASSDGAELIRPDIVCAHKFMSTGQTQLPSSPGDIVAAALNALLTRVYGSTADPFRTINPIVPPVSPLDLQLQASLLNAASQFNVSSVVIAAAELYAAGWGNAPVDFQSVVIASALRWSAPLETPDPDPAVWEALEAEYRTASKSGSANSSRILGVLAAPYNRVLLKKTLEYVLTQCDDGPCVKVGDQVRLITGVAANPFGRDLAYYYFESNWAYLMSKFGQGGFDLSSIATSLGSHFSTDAWLAKTQQFIAAHSRDLSGTMHAVNQGLESIGARREWVSLQAADFCEAL